MHRGDELDAEQLFWDDVAAAGGSDAVVVPYIGHKKYDKETIFSLVDRKTGECMDIKFVAVILNEGDEPEILPDHWLEDW